MGHVLHHNLCRTKWCWMNRAKQTSIALLKQSAETSQFDDGLRYKYIQDLRMASQQPTLSVTQITDVCSTKNIVEVFVLLLDGEMKTSIPSINIRHGETCLD